MKASTAGSASRPDDQLFDFLDRAKDPALTLDVMAYDSTEPDIVEWLETFGPRLRRDDRQFDKPENGKPIGHGPASSPESVAAPSGCASPPGGRGEAHALPRPSAPQGIHRAPQRRPERRCAARPISPIAASTSSRTIYSCSTPPGRGYVRRDVRPRVRGSRGYFRDNPSPRPGMSRIRRGSRPSTCASRRTRDRPLAQPDPRGDRSGHVIRTLFGRIPRPDDPGADDRGVSAV